MRALKKLLSNHVQKETVTTTRGYGVEKPCRTNTNYSIPQTKHPMQTALRSEASCVKSRATCKIELQVFIDQLNYVGRECTVFLSTRHTVHLKNRAQKSTVNA